MNSNRTQSFIIYFLLLVAIGAMLYVGFRQDTAAQQPLTINEVAKAVQSGTVARVIIENDDTIHIVYKSGKEADSHKETTATLVDQLERRFEGVDRATMPDLWGVAVLVFVPLPGYLHAWWGLLQRLPAAHCWRD